VDEKMTFPFEAAVADLLQHLPVRKLLDVIGQRREARQGGHMK